MPLLRAALGGSGECRGVGGCVCVCVCVGGVHHGWQRSVKDPAGVSHRWKRWRREEGKSNKRKRERERVRQEKDSKEGERSGLTCRRLAHSPDHCRSARLQWRCIRSPSRLLSHGVFMW